MPQRSDALEEVKARVKLAKGEDYIKNFKYMEEEIGLGVVRILCKCGTVISEFRSIPEMSTSTKVKNQTIIRERVLMTPNSNYTEIEILFDDGSKHISAVCADCIKRGFTPEHLNAIYAADMDQWRREEESGLGEVNWPLNAYSKAEKWREVTVDERFE